MYSMVVMMAMSTSPEAVACGKLFNKGCTGCTGAVYTGCTGAVYTGCTGYTPAYTGCTGVTYSGCTGSCHGSKPKLFGGGCHGGGLFSGGLFGGKHGNSCSGGYGCTGYAPVYTGCTGGVITPGAPPVVVPPPKKEMPKPKSGETSAPATITLKVPADAKVTIDGNSTTSTSSVRVFSTPTLPVGNVYTYTFTAEVVREGKVFTTSKQVAVTPGETAEIELNPSVITTIVAR
jgi:uncharacterized protein (TIGR03000 family)